MPRTGSRRGTRSSRLLTGVLFVLVALRFGLSPCCPAYLYLAAVAVALAAIDLDVHRLPDAIVLPSYLVGVALLAPAVLVDGDGTAALRGAAGALVLGGLYLGLALARPGAMGFGDVKLAGLLGLYLGSSAGTRSPSARSAAFLLGGTVGAVLLVTRTSQAPHTHPVRPVHAHRRPARPVRRGPGRALVPRTVASRQQRRDRSVRTC